MKVSNTYENGCNLFIIFSFSHSCPKYLSDITSIFEVLGRLFRSGPCTLKLRSREKSLKSPSFVVQLDLEIIIFIFFLSLRLQLSLAFPFLDSDKSSDNWSVSRAFRKYWSKLERSGAEEKEIEKER